MPVKAIVVSVVVVVVVVVVVAVVAVLQLLGYNYIYIYISGLCVSRDVSHVSYRDDPIFPILNRPSKGSAHTLKVVRTTLLKN